MNGNDMDKLDVLRRIWIEILEDEDITDDDNFLAIGGDSMMALEVASRARELGLEVSDSAVLRHPVLRDLADVAGFAPAQAG
ncbi:phosphopantetheine-binding protein [Micromonospora maritima]|uniref:phosphopantetheine-binding protein n=1 Tax=Micromonospora maritima TaxID=986711 RepID=UPI0037B5B472